VCLCGCVCEQLGERGCVCVYIRVYEFVGMGGNISGCLDVCVCVCVCMCMRVCVCVCVCVSVWVFLEVGACYMCMCQYVCV